MVGDGDKSRRCSNDYLFVVELRRKARFSLGYGSVHGGRMWQVCLGIEGIEPSPAAHSCCSLIMFNHYFLKIKWDSAPFIILNIS